MKRLLAMGDIHGMFDRFLEVWDAVQFRPDKDEIVFLGDYTDRGHQNAAMMKWVMAHEGEPGMVFLRGNHEAMCADGAGHAATLLEGDFMSDYHLTVRWRISSGSTTAAMRRLARLRRAMIPWRSIALGRLPSAG